jgi:hypothetical protein
MAPDSVDAPRDTVMLVCGGRNYTDKEQLWAALNGLLQDRAVLRVISGGAKGADTMAEEWAKAQGLECAVYHADWARLGRAARPIRNQQMLDEGRPTLVVAFPGGRGTADMVRRARSAGVEVIEITATPSGKRLSIAEQIKFDHPDLSDDEIRELLRREGE